MFTGGKSISFEIKCYEWKGMGLMPEIKVGVRWNPGDDLHHFLSFVVLAGIFRGFVLEVLGTVFSMVSKCIQ